MATVLIETVLDNVALCMDVHQKDIKPKSGQAWTPQLPFDSQNVLAKSYIRHGEPPCIAQKRSSGNVKGPFPQHTGVKDIVKTFLPSEEGACSTTTSHIVPPAPLGVSKQAL